MKKKFIGAALIVALLSAGVIACHTTDPSQVDQTNNVGIESYRAAIVKGQANLVGNIIPSLQAMKAADLAAVAPQQPQHTAAWWDAKIGLLMDTAALNSATLAGSNIGKPATAGAQ